MDGDKIELAADLNASQAVRVSIVTDKVQSTDSVAKWSDDVSAGTVIEVGRGDVDSSPGTPEEIVEQIKECGKGQLPRLPWEGSASVSLNRVPMPSRGGEGPG